jgi:hypothetical protein
MAICQEHNLAFPLHVGGRYGIRVSLARTDPFRNLVGADWRKEHWFQSTRERDDALLEMSKRYVYFRPGDQPALKFEKIEK